LSQARLLELILSLIGGPTLALLRQDNGVLSVSEQLEATFRVLLLSGRYELVNDVRAGRGNDLVGLMKNAEGSATGGVGPPGQ
jgi:hypothetical protein